MVEFSHVALLEDQEAILSWYQGVLGAELQHRRKRVERKMRDMQTCQVRLLHRCATPPLCFFLPFPGGGFFEMPGSLQQRSRQVS